MPSHFSTIGFPVENQNEFHSFAVKAFKEGRSTKTDSGIYIQWRENNGAELWVQLDKNNAVIGMAPHFSGKANMRVGLIETISRQNDTALDGAFYGWADPADENIENGAYPFVFDSPDFLINKVNLPTLINVQLAAFAHELKTLGGEIAVVIDPIITEDNISEGNILTGSFWLSGRLVSSDKATSRNFFERLIRNRP
jgi:hypothetical protein